VVDIQGVSEYDIAGVFLWQAVTQDIETTAAVTGACHHQPPANIDRDVCAMFPRKHFLETTLTSVRIIRVTQGQPWTFKL